MNKLTPLRFEPLYRRYLWGGRRLETILHKPLPPGNDYAESWEVVDHGGDQSVVAGGPLAGRTLHSLVRDFGEPLLGRHHPQNRFPLLFKFLDCQHNLSVQVHPNDEQAARRIPPDLGKTEAWLVLATTPGARVHAGLKPGVDRGRLEADLRQGLAERCLHSWEPQPGDCIFVPAGVVHALGAGLVVAEIQQSSDTTYRLFDWNRVDQDGRSRPLHITAGLDVIDFAAGPVHAQVPQPTTVDGCECLVACDKFVLQRWHIDGETKIDGADLCRILTVIHGRATLTGDFPNQTVSLGETILIPASCGELTVVPSELTTLIEMHLP